MNALKAYQAAINFVSILLVAMNVAVKEDMN